MPDALQEDSLKKRYLYKLSTNLMGLVLSFVTMSIIPRALGPSAYGSFHFLTDFFIKVFGFFDLGTSTCFYTKLSQRNNDHKLIQFYFGFVCLVVVFVFLLLGGAFALDLEMKLWPDQRWLFIWAGCLWGALTWLAGITNKIVDAYGLTVRSEIVRVAQKILSTLIIVILYWWGWINLKSFFIYHILILSLLIMGWLWVLKKRDIPFFSSWDLNKEKIGTYSKEFYQYSHPLFITSFVALIVGVGDRWILQKFAGSLEQGFYSLSYQVGAVCFLFTSAMTPLLLREFSLSFAKQDITKMASLFSRYVPMMYSIAAYFAVFLSLQAEKVVTILGGAEYQGATLALTVMILYPVHQTYGQLSSSLLMATGNTRLYRNIGVMMMVLGLIITFVLIAPTEWFGLNMGALGLALKMVFIQFLAVNLTLWFNVKLLELPFTKFIWHQAYSLMLMAVSAIISIKLIALVSSNLFVSFFLSGFLYTLIVGGVGYAVPVVFAVNRHEIHKIFFLLRSRLLRG